MHNVKSIFQMNTMISVYRSSPAKYQFSEDWIGTPRPLSETWRAISILLYTLVVLTWYEFIQCNLVEYIR